VYYRKEELPEIKKYLAKNYKNNHKSLSFLLHNEHGFHQAPLEEITKEAYDALVASTTLITRVEDATFEFDSQGLRIFTLDKGHVLAVHVRINGDKLEKYYWKPVLWTRAYYLITAGGAAIDILKQYIHKQSTPD
jgi:hypothetical protein